MRKARWIQISDLHIMLNSPAWANFSDRFFSFFESRSIHKPDFVVFSGDYRNIQKKESFEMAEQFIMRVKKEFKLSDNDIFMVPGNHDMDPQYDELDSRTVQMKKTLPPTVTPWERVTDSDAVEQKLKLCEEEPEDYIDRICNVRRTAGENVNAVLWEPLINGFGPYEQMAKAIISWYDEELRSPAEPHLRRWVSSDAETGFNIIHLNTAIMADGSRAHYQTIDLNKTISAFKKAEDKPSIVIAHNSFFDLHPQIQKQLMHSLSKAHTCCWLCGDAHKFDNASILCTSEKGAYFIPVFVCGKSAPDHSDGYSDIGFLSYEVEDATLISQQITWKDGELITLEAQHRPLATPDIADAKSSILRIGYLSCTPEKAPAKKYHLGHAYFIHLLDEWNRNNEPLLLLTSSYVFAHNRTVAMLEKQDEYTQNSINMWENCFDGAIKVIDIKEELQKENLLSSTEEKLYLYIGKVEMDLDRNTRWLSFVSDWHDRKKPIEDDAYSAIANIMGVAETKEKYTQNEVLSFAYLLFKRPTWYSGHWVVNFLHFWNSQLPNIIDKSFEKKHEISDIVIVESKRNDYVWDALAFCAKRFGYSNYPRAVYFDTINGFRDPKKAMKSSDTGNVVLLAGDGKKQYPERFRQEIQRHFNSTLEVDDIRSEYAKRLNLNGKK